MKKVSITDFYITLNVAQCMDYGNKSSDDDCSMKIVEAINSIDNMHTVGIEAVTFVGGDGLENLKWSTVFDEKFEEHIQKLLANHIESYKAHKFDQEEFCEWIEMCLEDYSKNKVYGLISIKDNFSSVNMMLYNDCCIDTFPIETCYNITSAIECFERYNIKLIIDYSLDSLKK